MGKKSSSGGTQTTTTEPPAYLKPYLQGALPAAGQLYNQGGPQQYTGNTVVPFSQQTEQAMQGISQRALNGSPLIDSAQNFVQNGLSRTPTSSFGTQSNPYAAGANPFGGASNPYLDAQFQHAAQQTQNQLSSEFARGGRNTNASAPIRGELLNNLATQIYAPAYENERNRQLQYGSQQMGIGANSWESGQDRRLQDLTAQRANQMGLLGAAQPLANQDYTDLGQLANVGSQIEGKTGQIIDDRVNRWNFEQNRPQANYDAYLGRITGQGGGYNTSTTQLPKQQSSPLGGAAGGAMLGAQFGGPWGALIGGGLGLLGGLF